MVAFLMALGVFTRLETFHSAQSREKIKVNKSENERYPLVYAYVVNKLPAKCK